MNKSFKNREKTVKKIEVIKEKNEKNKIIIYLKKRVENHRIQIFFFVIFVAIIILNPIWVFAEKQGWYILSPLSYPEGLEFFSSTLLTLIIAYYQVKLDNKFNLIQEEHSREDQKKHQNELIENSLKEIEERFKARAVVEIINLKSNNLKNLQKQDRIKITIKPKDEEQRLLFPPHFHLKKFQIHFKYLEELKLFGFSEIDNQNINFHNNLINIWFDDKLELDAKKMLWQFLTNSQSFKFNEKVSSLEFNVFMDVNSLINDDNNFDVTLDFLLIPEKGCNDKGEITCQVYLKNIFYGHYLGETKI